VKEASSSSVPNHSQDNTVVLDVAALTARALGRVEFIRTLAETFQKQAVSYLDRLDDAFQSSDPKRIANVAHAVKGTADLLGGRALRTVALQLEAAAEHGSLADLEPLTKRLRREIDRLGSALVEFADGARTEAALPVGAKT